MSLELNSKCIAALEKAVSNALKEIKVGNGKYVDSQSASSALSEIDKILPQGKKGKQIESYINEEPFAEFVTSKVRNLADEYGVLNRLPSAKGTSSASACAFSLATGEGGGRS